MLRGETTPFVRNCFERKHHRVRAPAKPQKVINVLKRQAHLGIGKKQSRVHPLSPDSAERIKVMHEHYGLCTNHAGSQTRADFPAAAVCTTSLTYLDLLEFGVPHLLLHGHDCLPLSLDLELLRPGSGQRFGRRGPLHGRPVGATGT